MIDRDLIDSFCDFLFENYSVRIDDTTGGTDTIEMMDQIISEYEIVRKGLHDADLKEQDRLSSCAGKQSHTSLDNAQKAAESARKKKAEPFEAYKCRHCEFWHIGHPKFWSKVWNQNPKSIGNSITVNGVPLLEFIASEAARLSTTLCSRCEGETNG